MEVIHLSNVVITAGIVTPTINPTNRFVLCGG